MLYMVWKINNKSNVCVVIFDTTILPLLQSPVGLIPMLASSSHFIWHRWSKKGRRLYTGLVLFQWFLLMSPYINNMCGTWFVRLIINPMFVVWCLILLFCLCTILKMTKHKKGRLINIKSNVCHDGCKTPPV